MWMGGGVPLGYRAQDRKLVVVPKEAATVEEIMRRYLKTPSIKELVTELRRDGFVSKVRISRNGNKSGGVQFKRGALKWLLSNRIYVGEIAHKDKIYPGQHKAIVDRELFDAVQTKLKDRTSHGSAGGARRRVALLAGMIRDDRGRPMSPTHTRNHGRRYTYYASNMNDDAEAPALRLPAGEIEQAVRQAIAKWLRNGQNLKNLSGSMSAFDKKRLFVRSGELAATIESAPISDVRTILEDIGLVVDISATDIRGTFDAQAAIGIEASDRSETEPEARFHIALDHKNYGHEARMRLQPVEAFGGKRDSRLAELLGRAFAARDTLLIMDETEGSTITKTRLRHLQRLARLSYVDPKIIRSILAGNHPAQLSSRNLWRMSELPLNWAAQRKALGFANL